MKIELYKDETFESRLFYAFGQILKQKLAKFPNL